MADQEEEFTRGANRFVDELSHAVADIEAQNWNEVESDLGSEAARELDKLIESGTLTDENKVQYVEQLDGLKNSLPQEDFPMKEKILSAIEYLRGQLA